MAKPKREDNSTTSTMELNLLNNNKKQVHDHQPNTMKSRPIIFILRNASLTKGFVHKVGAMAHGKINEEYADDFMSGIQQVAAADAPAPSPTSDAFTFAPTFFASLAALAFGFFF
ncbi:hypothetical protein C1H46_043257 [Malus baccata]|uniref:Uncharacterized protein n=1 Tax=Malus baccata TaxID=106549 RepID=A0A540KAE9_MALBA|nr:hypothetical protein C1H46_043257 [Malus baccata]